MVKVYYKVSTWRELEFMEGTTVQEIKNVVEKGDVYHLYDMKEFIGEVDMMECEEYLTPEDNGNASTIEIFDGDVLVWSNFDSETII